MPDTELIAAVTRITTVAGSAKLLIESLAQKLADAVAAATTLEQLQTSVSARVAEMHAGADDLATAVAANTAAEDEPEA